MIKKKQLIDQLIQVCWDLDDKKTKEREIRSLIKASHELKVDNLLVINNDLEKEEEINGRRIKFIPFYKWFLL